MRESKTRNPHLLVCCLIIAAVLVIYWQVPGYKLVAYDDDAYIYANPNMLEGLNAKTISWAFTTTYASNWHPLTWLSLAADMQLTLDKGIPAAGDQPGALYFHITNIALHIANALLLYLIFFVATGFVWRSAFVALLFAVHPLHVESVAWVTERKDVLSTFFWLLTTLAYIAWTRKRGRLRYALLVVLFALGLMAKPMLVSLPLVLLLMDYWPLHRLGQNAPKTGLNGVRALIIEKLPLFGLAAASGVVTLLAQHKSGAMGTLGAASFGERAANAVVAYVGYAVKMVCPIRLAVFYPHPLNTLPVWQVAGSIVLFAALCWFAIKQARSRPYVTAGWFWYVVTLAPVIGLIQVGRQAAADRYTYVPLIGLFVAIAWAVPELIPARQQHSKKNQPARPRWALVACGALIVVALTVAARVQTTYWADSLSLFTRAVSVTKGNYVAHSQLGNAILEPIPGQVGLSQDKLTEAIEHYREAIRIRPDFSDARFNLGVALEQVGDGTGAIEQYREAAKLNPKEPAIHNNLGYALVAQQQLEDAEREFRAAAKLDPDDAKAHNNIASICAGRGDFDEAVREFSRALRLDPDNTRIRANYERALAERDRRPTDR